jgi:hypothetical protein
MKNNRMKNTFTCRPHHSVRILFLILLGALVSGCASQTAQGSRLRITNSGSLPIDNLLVIFPGDRIRFGDISAGTTTEYKDLPNGVLKYAAYEFEIDGQTAHQAVIDWVGESPMPGSLFTYTIDFDPSRKKTGAIIRLVNVKTDQ